MLEDSLVKDWKEPWLERICKEHHLAWHGLWWLLHEGHLSITTNDETTTVGFRGLGPLFYITGKEISLGPAFTTPSPRILTLATDSRVALVVQDTQELLSAVQILDMFLRRTGFLVIGQAHHYLPNPDRKILAQSARYCFTSLEEGALHLMIHVQTVSIPLRALKIVNRKVEFDVSADELSHHRDKAMQARSNFASLWFKDQKETGRDKAL